MPIRICIIVLSFRLITSRLNAKYFSSDVPKLGSWRYLTLRRGKMDFSLIYFFFWFLRNLSTEHGGGRNIVEIISQLREKYTFAHRQRT